MTAPQTGTAPGSTTPWTITPGHPGVRITDGAAATPAGLLLVNLGTGGGTIYVTAGATSGAAVPIGPGGSLQWTDPTTFPYAYMTGAGAPETLLVTSQAGGYANPAATAAATAVQLAAQGIPSTFLDNGLGSYRLFAGQTSDPVPVGSSGSLVVGAYWPQPTPVGANALRFTWSDPAISDLAPIVYTFGVDNNLDSGAYYSWQLPVLAPSLTLTNIQPTDNNNSPCWVQVVGNNRTVPKVRQLGTDHGIHDLTLSRSNWVAGTAYPMPGTTSANLYQSRMNGLISLQYFAPAAGTLRANWVDGTGTKRAATVATPTAAGESPLIQWVHPPVPISWSFACTSALASGAAYLHLYGNTM